jgi:hypothetical protein
MWGWCGVITVEFRRKGFLKYRRKSDIHFRSFGKGTL